MEEKQVFAGFGVVIAVMIVVALVRAVLPEPVDMSAEIQRELGPVNEAMTALGDRIGEGETAISDRVAAIETAFEERLVGIEEGLGQELNDLRSALGALADSAADAVSQTDLEALRDQVAALAAGAAAAATPPASEGESAAAETPSQMPSETPAETSSEMAAAATDAGPDGLKPGQTLSLADGAMRVFISRLDPETGRVRAFVNGDDRTLRQGIGRTARAGDGFCRLMLDGVSGNGAVLSGLCNDELPEAEGTGTGETAMLGDGALRVFVSRVLEDSARLSVNDQKVTIEAGERDVLMAGEQSCRLTVDQVDRGHASLSAVCTDAVTQSEDMRAGQTALLGDGAARVFVSRIADGMVRLSLNGLDLVSAAAGDTIEMADECDMTVEGVSRGAARFSHACF